MLNRSMGEKGRLLPKCRGAAGVGKSVAAIVKIRSGKNQQVLYLGAMDFNFDKEQEICALLKCVPTDCKGGNKQSSNYTVEKSSHAQTR